MKEKISNKEKQQKTKEKWKALSKAVEQALKESFKEEKSIEADLVKASGSGDLAGVQKAIAAGAKINAIHEFGNRSATALMEAAEGGHWEIVNELLKAGANPNIGGLSKDWDLGITPLIVAAQKGRVGIVRKLIEAGASPETCPGFIFELLHKKNGLGLLKPLLDKNVDPDEKEKEVSKLINEGLIERGDSAIHAAAKAGHSDIVKLLLDAGVSPEAKGASGTVFEAAAASGDSTTMEMVLAAKPKLSGKKLNAKILVNASASGNLKLVQMLLDMGADVNKRTRKDESALSEAVCARNIEIVKLLISAGAKPCSEDMPEIMIAAGNGDKEIIEILIKAGADVNASNHMGCSLHCAVTRGRADIVEILLKSGASIKIRDNEGKTPLEYARQSISSWTNDKDNPLRSYVNIDEIKKCAELLEKAEGTTP
jgi:ankyrin repeat protein